MATTITRAKRPHLESSSKDREKKESNAPAATRTMLFIPLTLLAGALSLLFLPNQSSAQLFYIRILIALGAAGITVLLPGFIEIQLAWLRNAIRASGALGVFLLIFAINPPEIERLQQLEEFEGEYEYECTKAQGVFLHGGFQHGGSCRIRIIKTPFGKACSITGEREWTRKDKDAGKIMVNNPSVWQTQGCNYTADDKIMYQYVTTEKDARYLGITVLKIERDPSGNYIGFVGSFQREAPAQDTHGTIIMRRKK